jgi:glutathione S-transferase
MDPSGFLAARADAIVDAAVAAMAKRHFVHYERLGRDAAARRVRDLFDRVSTPPAATT